MKIRLRFLELQLKMSGMFLRHIVECEAGVHITSKDLNLPRSEYLQ